MGSDRARVTFDERRKYRRVVAQQGRAIVDADLNEAQEIITEEMRREALDVVGPSGTPDNGYQVVVPATLLGPSLPVTLVTGNTLTAVNHNLSGGQGIVFTLGSGGVLPAPLTTGTTYYVIWVDHNDFQVSTTPSPSVITLTSTGTLPFNVVQLPLPYDIQISQGTLYVGGMRVTLQAPILYSNQPDWPPNLPNSPSMPSSPTAEIVYLQLIEQEVSAWEDAPLREVALGGPDTAQRTRLLQHIVRFSVTPPTSPALLSCATAEPQLITSLGTQGLTFDSNTMRLTSTCTLQATFTTPTASTDPCLPATQTGYLGAENQLIRVQIAPPVTTVPPPATAPVLVWAYDDASALYPANLVTTTTTQTIVQLTTGPVDANHQPRSDQYAELLFVTTQLDTHGNYVAAATGILVGIASYDPGALTLTLNVTFGSPGSQAVTVWVRIWETPITLTAGTPLAIGATGLSVTLNTTGTNPFVIGQYWMLALRPNAPTQVFPQRYLDAPQPPDGPRQWLCPLGVVEWSVVSSIITGTVVADCLQPFLNLVELTQRGCWPNILITPAQVGGGWGLQSLIDQIMTQYAGQEVIIGLLPGIYVLPQPLVFTSPLHDGLTLQAKKGAVLMANPAVLAQQSTLTPTPGSPPSPTLPLTSFLHGLILVLGVNGLTLDGFTLLMPSLLYVNSGGSFFDLWCSNPAPGGNLNYLYNVFPGFVATSTLNFQDLYTLVGLRVIGGGIVKIKNCVFDYSSAPSPGSTQPIFAAGILSTGVIGELDVIDSLFAVPSSFVPLNEYALAFGILNVPTSQIVTSYGSGVWTATGTTLPAVLVAGLVQGNVFSGLTAAALYYTMPLNFGFEQNVVLGCYAGLWLLHTLPTLNGTLTSGATFLTTLTTSLSSSLGYMDSSVGTPPLTTTTPLLDYFKDPLIGTGSGIGRAFPLPTNMGGTTSLNLGATPAETSLHGVLSLFEGVMLAAGAESVSQYFPTTVYVTDNEFTGASTNPWLLGSTGTYGTGYTPPPTTPAGAGNQLLIWDAYPYAGTYVVGAGATAILGRNQMISYAQLAVALTIDARAVTVTGNTVENRTTGGTTFSLFSLPKITTETGLYPYSATGNIFVSPSALPKRPDVYAPYWSTYNYEQPTP
jgi:hypothetical protein